MKRTQLYLPEEEHAALHRTARATKRSMAELVRVYIKNGLEQQRTTDNNGLAALKKLVAIGSKGGPADLSANLDHYLYGGPKRR